MNKKFAFAVAAAAIVVAGCATVPSVEKMFGISRAIGYAAGLVTNEIKMDNEVRNKIIEIWTEVSVCIPETNQTFAAAWMPIAERHTAELVKQGKIDENQAKLILLGFNAAVTGLDYVFIRFPKAKAYKDLTVAAIDGFSEGFLTIFKPVNALTGVVSGKENGYGAYDKDAYDYLKNLIK